MDMDGDTVWSKIYGDYDTDVSYSIDIADYNGFISTGWTNAFGAGGSDFWLLRCDRYGDTLWTKTFGGPNADRGFCVKHTSGGGFIIVGSTYSFGSGGSDVYVVKTDSLGETEWIREVPTKPQEFSMNVYPNPFNASCKIEAPLGTAIEIFDINGRLVDGLSGGLVGEQESPHLRIYPSTHLQSFTWTPDENLPSGVYFVKPNAGEKKITKKGGIFEVGLQRVKYI